MPNQFYDHALKVLHDAISDKGILASSVDADNYQRVWSRDSNIAGLAGFIANDTNIKEGWINSLVTLFNAQHPIGAIPSNVSLTGKSSYGSLAGRVDATTWALVGAAINYKELDVKVDALELKVRKAIRLLDAWEFNGRHLIYTPLSGNWADEYPVHGYLLYDNVLRYWAIKAWAELLDDQALYDKVNEVKKAIQNNFYLSKNQKAEHLYHKALYDRYAVEGPDHFITGFHPGGVFEMFDATGHGLLLMLKLANQNQVDQLEKYILHLWESNVKEGFVPAFWPPINREDDLWSSIANNYAYNFKNTPHHFHNGGIWPVMMGILALGLINSGKDNIKDTMAVTYEEHLRQNEGRFFEYIDSRQYLAAGKNPLCFSAAGYIFLNSNYDQIKQLGIS